MEADSLSTAEKRQPKLRWIHLTPGRLLVILLALESGLILSESWFYKGWAALTSVAIVGVFLLIMLLWFVASMFFRWRFQFSVRSLLMLTVVVAIPCSWLAVEMKRARARECASKAVYQCGGGVYTVCKPTWKKPLFPTLTDFLRLREFLGADFFDHTDSISLDDTPATDATLEIVGVLTDTSSLDLDKTQITDAGLEHLKRLTNLRSLSLSHTQITDAGLEHLKRLTQLQTLKLWDTKVTDAGLDHLKVLTKLQSLLLANTNVTDMGVNKLQKALPNCKIEH